MVSVKKREKCVIRIQKKGRKYYPLFNVVVIHKEQRSKGGWMIDRIGFINTNGKNKLFFFSTEKLGYWIGKGAKINRTVKSYLRKFGVFKNKSFIAIYYYFYWYNKKKRI